MTRTKQGSKWCTNPYTPTCFKSFSCCTTAARRDFDSDARCQHIISGKRHEHGAREQSRSRRGYKPRKQDTPAHQSHRPSLLCGGCCSGTGVVTGCKESVMRSSGFRRSSVAGVHLKSRRTCAITKCTEYDGPTIFTECQALVLVEM